MTWTQKEIRLSPRGRGFHLITVEVVARLPELAGVRCGILHLFITHTSASLTLNENADPAVRLDMESGMNRIVPEGVSYEHDAEGADDMPAHLKASLMGSSVSIPVTDGTLALGTWQGIYLCEHRDRGGSRRLIATISGDRSA
jgi:secondary thiamine-phosphate synthase enzyme